MVARNFGEKSVKERPHDPGQHVDGAAFLAHAHQPEPQREHAGQPERNLESDLRHLERAADHRREDLGIAEEDELDRTDDEGDEKEAGPDVIEYHV